MKIYYKAFIAGGFDRFMCRVRFCIQKTQVLPEAASHDGLGNTLLLYSFMTENDLSTLLKGFNLDPQQGYKEEFNHKVHQEHEGAKRKKLLPFVSFVPLVVDFSSFLFCESSLVKGFGEM
ncbi:hypothetical protein ACYULU_00695 [Breznakiellaceae bacterium SP9]